MLHVPTRLKSMMGPKRAMLPFYDADWEGPAAMPGSIPSLWREASQGHHRTNPRHMNIPIPQPRHVHSTAM